MNTQQFREALSGESVLSDKDISDCLRRYPYFQIARWMQLKSTPQLTPLEVEKRVANIAVYSPDRDELFYFVEKEKLPWRRIEQMMTKSNTLQQEEHDSTFFAIDTFLSLYDKSGREEKELAAIIEMPITDYTPLLSQKEEQKRPADTSTTTFGMIDDFLRKKDEEGVTLHVVADNIPFQSAPIVSESPAEEASADDFLTESLAKIYIRQRRYAKALEIIKKISLKYPEKNIYFADQIRFLEKLIINIKPE